MKKEYTLSPNDSKGWDEVARALFEAQEHDCVITIDTTKRRTKPQNKAIHKACSMLADALNSSGKEMVRTLKILRKSNEIEIMWDRDSVKQYLWRPVQKAMFDTDSTADLDTRQVSQVYEVLNRNLADKLGVSVPFPDKRG